MVDDSLTIRMQVKDLLEENGFEVLLAQDGLECLKVLDEETPDVILLDIIMPEMDGIEVCRRIKDHEKLLDIPVIILTNVTDTENKVSGLNAGADDYITKPFAVEELMARVDSVIRTKKLFEQLREEIKFRREAETRLKELSTHDTLTGLTNRLQMDDIVKREFKRAQRYDRNLSFLMFDLDFFKDVNDSYGHAFGDFVLKEFASDLKKHVRDSDLLFRYGGEEFLAVLPEASINGAEKAAEITRRRCEKRNYDFEDRSISVTVSIGISSIQDHHPATAEEMLRYADQALYQAKAEGRNRVRAYRSESSASHQEQRDQGGNPLKYVKEHLSAILEKTKDSSISSLELLVRDMGDARFTNHKKQVLQYMELMGSKLHLPPNIIETFKRAASLHDCFCNILLGKALITNKGDLNEEEKQKIKDHPYMLVELTEVFDFFVNERTVLLYHHENYDGSGYPYGLSGDQIPLGARVYAIVDALVSMSSERSYREKFSPEQILDELIDNAGRQFDPVLVDLFIGAIEENRLLNADEETFGRAKEKIEMVCNKRKR